MIELHPEFDGRRWSVFHGITITAKTLRELQEVLGHHIRLIGYYPNGYTLPPWPEDPQETKRLPLSMTPQQFVQHGQSLRRFGKKEKQTSSAAKIPINGYSLRRGNPTWSNEDFKKAIEMSDAGKTASQIADAIGKSRNSVIGKLSRHKYEIGRKLAKSIQDQFAGSPLATDRNVVDGAGCT
jgi:hypothetical protein